jgi:PhnB protein
MKLYAHLSHAGNCEQAFRFYEEHLGGKITMRIEKQPAAEWRQGPT